MTEDRLQLESRPLKALRHDFQLLVRRDLPEGLGSSLERAPVSLQADDRPLPRTVAVMRR